MLSFRFLLALLLGSFTQGRLLQVPCVSIIAESNGIGHEIYVPLFDLSGNPAGPLPTGINSPCLPVGTC